MTSAGLDIKKMPLEAISLDTIKEGYAYLCEMEKVLLKIKDGKAKLTSVYDNLLDLSSKFYNTIPHDFGR